MPQTAPLVLPKILLLSSAESEENMAINDAFVTQLNKRLAQNCQLEWQNYHNIGLEMVAGKLYPFIISDGRPLTDFRAVYFKSYFRYHEQATAIAEALVANNVTFVGSELKHYIPAYKLSQLARLARHNFQIAHTIYLPLEHFVSNFDMLQAKLGKQFIFKAIDGSTGNDNYLVTNKQQLTNIVAASPERHFVAQAFIANDSDLRFLIVGGDIKLIIERRRKDNSTHLNNTSQGAAARLLPNESVSPDVHQLALNVARLMDREVAGVDIMLEHGTGAPYILEVNASPQVGSGAYQAEKLDAYADYFTSLAMHND